MQFLPRALAPQQVSRRSLLTVRIKKTEIARYGGKSYLISSPIASK
jgi:hypothetical protein